MKDHVLVMVEWEDPHSPDATTTYSIDELDSVHRPMRIVTVGWLLRDTPEGLTVACEYCGGKEFRGLTFITRPLVKSITIVKKPRKRAAKTAPAFNER